ncbi:hypothetical protein, partial [Caldisericum sp.]|uniref:hypothetical protein n=1 Tax=Caldisericum sp. TaxID=2499687 RepID=UPI003D0B01EF
FKSVTIVSHPSLLATAGVPSVQLSSITTTLSKPALWQDNIEFDITLYSLWAGITAMNLPKEYLFLIGNFLEDLPRRIIKVIKNKNR